MTTYSSGQRKRHPQADTIVETKKLQSQIHAQLHSGKQGHTAVYTQLFTQIKSGKMCTENTHIGTQTGETGMQKVHLISIQRGNP